MTVRLREERVALPSVYLPNEILYDIFLRSDQRTYRNISGVDRQWNFMMGVVLLPKLQKLHIIPLSYKQIKSLYKKASASRCEVYIDVSGSMRSLESKRIVLDAIEKVQEIFQSRSIFVKRIKFYTFANKCYPVKNESPDFLNHQVCKGGTNLDFLNKRLIRYSEEKNTNWQLSVFVISDLDFNKEQSDELFATIGKIHDKVKNRQNFSLSFIEIPFEEAVNVPQIKEKLTECIAANPYIKLLS